jgi:hypothetical protein
VSVDVTPSASSTTTYYLSSPCTGDVASAPVLPFGVSAPTDVVLSNYDTDRDTDPGLHISRSSDGLSETDPRKRQVWSTSLSSPLKLDGPASLTVWAAIEDFDVTRTGTVLAALQECNASGTNCTTLATSSAALDQSSGGPTWMPLTISFGAVDRTVGKGKVLAVKIAVANSSDDDVWFAYDTVAYSSSLQLTTRQ